MSRSERRAGGACGRGNEGDASHEPQRIRCDTPKQFSLLAESSIPQITMSDSRADAGLNESSEQPLY